jgi:hypothetical protein
VFSRVPRERYVSRPQRRDLKSHVALRRRQQFSKKSGHSSAHRRPASSSSPSSSAALAVLSSYSSLSASLPVRPSALRKAKVVGGVSRADPAVWASPNWDFPSGGVTRRHRQLGGPPPLMRRRPSLRVGRSGAIVRRIPETALLKHSGAQFPDVDFLDDASTRRRVGPVCAVPRVLDRPETCHRPASCGKVLEQSAGGLPVVMIWPPRGRWSSAAFPPAACAEVLRNLVAQVVCFGLDRFAEDATEDRRAVGVLMDRGRLPGRPSRLALPVLAQRALPSRRGAER